MDPRRKSPAKVSQKVAVPRKVSLGVDVIEMKKARMFYEENKNRLHSYFSRTEMKLIRKSAKPCLSLAMLLAAKEAVFKASRMNWMGTDGFRMIRIISNRNNRLSFRLSGNYKTAFARRPHPTLSFLTSKDFVIAECR